MSLYTFFSKSSSIQHIISHKIKCIKYNLTCRLQAPLALVLFITLVHTNKGKKKRNYVIAKMNHNLCFTANR
ncbi:hypothetical protein Hanom_Chr10g00953501 [Helianthus anomalus]